MTTQTTAAAPLLTAREAAEFLKISPRKLWSMTASRAVPSIRLGRSVRYDQHDLQAFVDSRRQEVASDA